MIDCYINGIYVIILKLNTVHVLGSIVINRRNFSFLVAVNFWKELNATNAIDRIVVDL